jgi:hypothetical protein
MSSLAIMTVEQWIGLVGLICFSAVLIWPLRQGHKSPPGPAVSVQA